MFFQNNTKIQCKITDANNITIEGSVYLEHGESNSNSIRVIIDPTIVNDSLRRSFEFPAEIRGSNELGEEVFISEFWRTSDSHHYQPKYAIEWIGTGNVIYKGIGLETEIDKNQKISIQLAIPFSALTSTGSHIDQKKGELKIKESSNVDLNWVSGDYRYSMYNLFTTEENTNISNPIINVRKKSFVTINFAIKEQKHFKVAVDEAVDYFETLLPLLGFLGKKRIDWYEFEATAITKGNNQPILEVSARKNTYFPEITPQYSNSSWLDIPVTETALKDEIIDKLITNLNNHKNKEPIIRAIQYLLSSYEEKYFFSQLVSSYTAFETLVAELSKTQKIDTTLHGNLYKELVVCIQNYLDTHIEDEEKRKTVLQKVPELKRAPIKETFQKLFNPQDYPLSRFMFNNTDWENNIGGLISRRNMLVHAGEIKREHYLDLYRLHLLLQLWILTLLGCPDEYVNEYIASTLKNMRLV